MAFTVGKENRDIFSRLRKMTPANRLMEFNRYNRSIEGNTPFTRLTPTQFAELFPKYYMEKLPDVGGFFKALNSKKELGGEGKTYGPHGNTEGSATPSSNERVTNTVRAKEIYDYIRSKGVDHNHAVGIVNNMKYESKFDSGAIGDGGTSGGLFQHHASRFSSMKNYVGDGWQTNWKKQIDFAMTEGEMKSYLGKNYANASDASMGFTRTFEIPANTEQTAAYRAGTAEGYGTAMSSSGVSTTTSGNTFETTSSGYVVPKDKAIYSPGNEEQCATLAKGFNPDIGRSSSWSVVPGEIKPGVAVATMRYNLPGGDRTGSGYHSGVAMSSPDKDGNFLLLEQFSGQPARVKKVNVNYGGGAMGGSTQFGLISSGGKLHTEQSMEALNYGASKSGDEEVRKAILSNHDSVLKGNTTGDQKGTGSVSVNDASTPAGAPGPQTNLQQQESVKNIQTATIGDMFKMVGDLAGFFMRGEGVGDGRGRKRGHGHRGHGRGEAPTPKEHETHVAPVESLLSFISQGEGGYNAMNQGTRGKKIVGSSNESHKVIGKNLSDMTVGDVMDMQKGSLKSGRKIFAAGRYQMIPSTMKNAVAMAGISRDAIFNKETQDKLGMALMQSKPKLNAYLMGKSGDSHGALRDMANEWRSIPHPDTGRAVGGGPNKSHHSVESVRQALASARSEIASRPVEKQLAKAQPSAGPVIPNQTASITPAPGASYLDQIKSKMSGYYEGFANRMVGLRSSITGQETGLAAQPEFPSVGAKQNEVPLPPHRPTTFGNEQAPAPTPDKQTFNSAPAAEPKQQQPIVADTFLNRGDPQFASPSMERQIKNTMNPSASNEAHSFLPSIG